MIEYALQYVARSWFIFPLKPRSKLPLISSKQGGRGFHDATTDKAQIEKWWRACPEANIGLATGASGLVVIDIDGPEGLKELEAVARQWGGDSAWPLPKTLASRTGREGGIHLFYSGASIPSSQVKGSHVDVRGSSGYVVLPPSVHPSGTIYQWMNWP
jgi:hypothetical protein